MRHTSEQIVAALAADHGVAVTVVDLTDRAGGFENELFRATLDPATPAPAGWPESLIVRVSDRAAGAAFVHRVSAVHNWCVQHEYPAPPALGLGALGERDAYFVMPFVDAPPSIEHLFRPGRSKIYLETFVDLHLRLHDLPQAGFPGRQDSFDQILREITDAAAHIPAAAPIGDWLLRHRGEAEHGADRVVCHFDYHPINVLWKWKSDPVVIDWDSAGLGSRAADVAITAELFAMGDILYKRRLMGAIVSAVGGLLCRSYLKRYQARHPLNPLELRFWRVFQAANVLVWSTGGSFMDTVVRADRIADWSPRLESIVLRRFRALTANALPDT